MPSRPVPAKRQAALAHAPSMRLLRTSEDTQASPGRQSSAVPRPLNLRHIPHQAQPATLKRHAVCKAELQLGQATRLEQHVACERLRSRRAGRATNDLHTDAGAAFGLEDVAGQVLGRKAAVVAAALRVLRAQRASGVQAAQVPARQAVQASVAAAKTWSVDMGGYCADQRALY